MLGKFASHCFPSHLFLFALGPHLAMCRAYLGFCAQGSLHGDSGNHMGCWGSNRCSACKADALTLRCCSGLWPLTLFLGEASLESPGWSPGCSCFGSLLVCDLLAYCRSTLAQLQTGTCVGVAAAWGRGTVQVLLALGQLSASSRRDWGIQGSSSEFLFLFH